MSRLEALRREGADLIAGLDASEREARAMEAERLPPFQRYLERRQASDGLAAQARWEEGFAALREAEGRLAASVETVQEARPRAEERQKEARELRRQIAGLNPPASAELGAADSAIGRAEHHFMNRAFVAAADQFAAVLPMLRPMLAELSKPKALDCRVARGPEGMLSVVAGEFDARDYRAGEAFRGSFVRLAPSADKPISIAEPYCLQIRRVTQKEFKDFVDTLDPNERARLIGRAATQLAASDRPVTDVSFEAAERYAEWLSGQTSRRFRLPTPEQWLAGLVMARRDMSEPAIIGFEGTIAEWTRAVCSPNQRMAAGPVVGDYDIRARCAHRVGA